MFTIIGTKLIAWVLIAGALLLLVPRLLLASMFFPGIFFANIPPVNDVLVVIPAVTRVSGVDCVPAVFAIIAAATHVPDVSLLWPSCCFCSHS